MQKELEIIRERRKMWEQRLPDVYDILYQGSMKAKTVAANTLEEVKHSMKIDYFENKNLLSKENEREYIFLRKKWIVTEIPLQKGLQ